MFLLSALVCNAYAGNKDAAQEESGSESDVSQPSKKSVNETHTKKEQKNNKKQDKAKDLEMEAEENFSAHSSAMEEEESASEMEPEASSAEYSSGTEEDDSSSGSEDSEIRENNKKTVRVFIVQGMTRIGNREGSDQELSQNFEEIYKNFQKKCQTRDRLFIKYYSKGSPVQEGFIRWVEENVLKFTGISYHYSDTYEHCLLDSAIAHIAPGNLMLPSTRFFLTNNLNGTFKDQGLTKLQILNLSGPHNLEFISFMNALNLKELVINDTYCSTKPLSKAYFPLLETIGVDLREIGNPRLIDGLSNHRVIDQETCQRISISAGQNSKESYDALTLKGMMYSVMKIKSSTNEDRSICFTSDSSSEDQGPVFKALTGLWGSSERIYNTPSKYDIGNFPVE